MYILECIKYIILSCKTTFKYFSTLWKETWNDTSETFKQFQINLQMCDVFKEAFSAERVHRVLEALIRKSGTKLVKIKNFHNWTINKTDVVKHTQQSHYKFLGEITVNDYLLPVTFMEISFQQSFMG